MAPNRVTPLFLLALALVPAFGAARHLVWPPPQQISAAGPPLSLHPQFAARSSCTSRRLAAALARHAETTIGPALAAAKSSAQQRLVTAGHGEDLHLLRELELVVGSADESLGMATDYSYNLTARPATSTEAAHAEVRCASIYGCMYGLESFAQLLDTRRGTVLHSLVDIVDAPDYTWRGLMVDAGRRFFPMDTLIDLMTTMSANKLNVLHLHASDFCRFGVESKLYPNLTASLTGVKGGFYTQQDIKTLIERGGEMGIRIVPEFDIPGHSKGFEPLAWGPDPDILFCGELPDVNQLYDDPAGVTYKTLHAIMGEMAALFTDEVFNIGSDETSAKGRCTVNTSFAIERRLLQAIQTDFKKTPAGWEEVLFDAGAATPETIVDAWSRHTPAEITATGRRAIESKGSHFYFTRAAAGGPKGWAPCWFDIATGVPAEQRSLLLGGEMSMWSDTYCYINQCQSPGQPVGARLFPPEQDAAFRKSIGGTAPYN